MAYRRLCRKIYGIISYIDVYHVKGTRSVDQYVRKGDFTIGNKETLLDALQKMESNRCSLLVIIDELNNVVGITTRNKIIRVYFEKKKALFA